MQTKTPLGVLGVQPAKGCVHQSVGRDCCKLLGWPKVLVNVRHL